MLKQQGKIRLNTSGFTLIEVLVTIAIFGIVIMPLSGFFVQSARMNAQSKEKLISTLIAQRYLEKNKANSQSLVSSDTKTEEVQDPIYPEYHVRIVTSPYGAIPSVTPPYTYQYKTEEDVLPDVNMYVVFNDGEPISADEKNCIMMRENGETKPFLKVDTGSLDAILNVTINSGVTSPNVTFTGSSVGGTLSTDETRACNLVKSPFSDNNVENIKVEINTNKDITINVSNLLSKNTKDGCIFYIVHKKGKTGKVFGRVLTGKVDFIENLYDKTIAEGLPKQGLYKVVVTVYKGKNSSGKKLYQLESLLK